MAQILLIEDTQELADVVSRELEADGHHVARAADGATGLDMHDAAPPDLVILDWMLPRMDGMEVLRRIRQRAATPVLMLTARDAEGDRVLGLELGADDYLAKPFGMRELLARVHAILRRVELVRATMRADRAAAVEAERVTYGDLALDPAAHRATLAGAELDLTPTEFALLLLLLRSPGRAFSRAYLLDTLWGESYVGGDRSVDNSVLRLRKKLGPLGDAIETVWGVGYRLRGRRP